MTGEVARAYRQLYKHALRAVRYSTPGRHTIREQLRQCFRQNDASKFNRAKIDNTLEFLKAAGKEAGLEHRVLRTLLMMWFWQRSQVLGGAYEPDAENVKFRQRANDHFNHTVHMLNESMENNLHETPASLPVMA